MRATWRRLTLLRRPCVTKDSGGYPALDVTDHEASSLQVNGYETNHGAITILINNAGMQHRTAPEDFPIDAFDRLMKTNVHSVFHVGQAVARHMIKRGSQAVSSTSPACKPRWPVPVLRLYRLKRCSCEFDQRHGHRLGQIRAEL